MAATRLHESRWSVYFERVSKELLGKRAEVEVAGIPLASDEMQTFILSPPGIALPKGVTHPAQLYEHFIPYTDPPQST